MAEQKLIDLVNLTDYDLLIKKYANDLVTDNIQINTTAVWNSNVDYVPKAGAIIIYSDGSVIDGVAVPKLKVGDGNAHLVDLPFSDVDIKNTITQHIENNTAHITAQEREKWNNHVSVSVENESMVFKN